VPTPDKSTLVTAAGRLPIRRESVSKNFSALTVDPVLLGVITAQPFKLALQYACVAENCNSKAET
jgi:hypothetical protein